jgi:hypothetical protein
VADAETDPTSTAAASPATTTYAWTNTGADCDDCGEAATRRWRDGEQLVCQDCKEW